jgi:tetratricopeptide (TPR) repeat protein
VIESIDWGGTERYEVRGCLGRGGMGVVYAVHDRESDRLVAAKRLLHYDPGALYLFKQEFRTLADVQHPNLVRFYDLVQDEGGDAFFTMELVHGVDFLCFSRGALGDDAADLRSALRQLVAGIRALHAAGKLHRDIKPSNVLVTEAGRVVLLDFGVATELAGRTGRAPTPSDELVGSAIYMAPEHIHGQELAASAASDWYSLGVMLYEALVGRPPFSGTVIDVLTRKITTDPSPPSTELEGVPADLDALCMALLHRDPEKRPAGAEIARRLGTVRSSAPAPAPGSAGSTFIGRRAQLDALASAFDASRRELTAVRVGGRAGVGKYTLVQEFVSRVEQHDGAVVLRGRIHEREAVPYKAIDGVVDSLSTHLVARESDADPLELPADLWALARLFPVLRRVAAVAELVEPPIADPLAVRERAVAAFRSLLATFAARAPVVVFIHDAQWGDLDSANLLLELVRPPGAPRLLLAMTYRDTGEDGPFLVSLRERWPAGVATREVVVGPLDAEEAEALSLSLIGSTDVQSRRVARAVARESGGAPFLVEELTRSHHALRSTTGEALGAVSLEQMVMARLERLPRDARAALDAIAVGGGPVRTSVVGAVCDLTSTEETIAYLVAQRLARTSFRGAFEVVEASHDRIRETLVKQLGSEALRDTHGNLARVLAVTPDADAEQVAEHWLASGDQARAAQFAEKGAERAAAALAFDRAARLFRRTIELLPPSSPDVVRCRERLAEALKYAGRSEEAAQAYVAAAEGASPERRIDLRREAAHQLLAGGHIAKAGDVLRDVLDAVGMPAPRSLLGALVWLGIYSLWSRALGVRLRELPPHEVPAARQLRIDALYTVVGGFSMVDPVLGACMQARHFVEVLRGADTYRLVRAVGLEVAHAASAGKPETARERALLDAGARICERHGDGDAELFFNHMLGLIAFQRSRWTEAQVRLDRDIDAFPYGRPGMAIVRIYSLLTSFYRGDIAVTIERSRQLLARAEDRGDLYTSVNLRATTLAAACMADDDAEGARALIQAALAHWPQDRFSVQHWHAMIYGIHVELYAGEGAAAYERCLSLWPALRKSLMLQSVAARIPALYLRVQVAIASLERGPQHAAVRIAEARGLAKRLEAECDPLATVMASLAHAMANRAAGDVPGAVASLRRAIERAAATGTGLFLVPARHRLGLLLGGDEGRAMVAAAEAELRAQGVRNPVKWVRVYLPWPWTNETSSRPN